MQQTQPTEDDISVVYLITKQFQTKDEFSQYIIQFAESKRITYMEALLEYSYINDSDPISIASIINSSLKKLIQQEADGLNLLKRK